MVATLQKQIFLLAVLLMSAPLARAADALSVPLDECGPQQTLTCIEEAFASSHGNLKSLELAFYDTFSPVFYGEPIERSVFQKNLNSLTTLVAKEKKYLSPAQQDAFTAYIKHWQTADHPAITNNQSSWKKRAATAALIVALVALLAAGTHKKMRGTWLPHKQTTAGGSPRARQVGEYPYHPDTAPQGVGWGTGGGSGRDRIDSNPDDDELRRALALSLVSHQASSTLSTDTGEERPAGTDHDGDILAAITASLADQAGSTVTRPRSPTLPMEIISHTLWPFALVQGEAQNEAIDNFIRQKTAEESRQNAALLDRAHAQQAKFFQLQQLAINQTKQLLATKLGFSATEDVPISHDQNTLILYAKTPSARGKASKDSAYVVLKRNRETAALLEVYTQLLTDTRAYRAAIDRFPHIDYDAQIQGSILQRLSRALPPFAATIRQKNSLGAALLELRAQNIEGAKLYVDQLLTHQPQAEQPLEEFLAAGTQATNALEAYLRNPLLTQAP